MRSLLLILFTSSILLACDTQNSPTSKPSESSTKQAKAETTNAVEFIEPWIRAVPKVSPNSAAYVEIKNSTDKTVNLTGIQSQLADRIEIHTIETDDAGTMKMMEVDQVAIAPGETALLEPGGKHIMIFGLQQPLNIGDMATMLLSFDQQPPIPVTFTVK